VYFLEYTVITAFADKATHKFADDDEPIKKNVSFSAV
jgi:hypothetical protein